MLNAHLDRHHADWGAKRVVQLGKGGIIGQRLVLGGRVGVAEAEDKEVLVQGRARDVAAVHKPDDAACALFNAANRSDVSDQAREREDLVGLPIPQLKFLAQPVGQLFNHSDVDEHSRQRCVRCMRAGKRASQHGAYLWAFLCPPRQAA